MTESATSLARPVVRWHGGKWRLAPWIMDQFSPHKAYVEPFGGGASVLLRKERSKLEVYNDLDGEAVNFFRQLRDRGAELAVLVSRTPFSREEFDRAHEAADCPLERARRFLIRSHFGHGSNSVHMRSGFRSAGVRSGTLPVHLWATFPTVIASAAIRMAGVVIENRPAIDIMARFDGPDVLHFVDPPYLMETRSDARADYAHELTDGDHKELLQFLPRLEGRVILCGYPSAIYDQALPDWGRIEREAAADGGVKRTEVLWINRPAEGLL